MSPELALNDRPSFSGGPSLTGHCGHGWTCSLPRPVAIDVMNVLLAEEEAKSVEEALEYNRKGVEAGVQVLGPKGFKEYAAHFWGVLETRPYMRARAGLAATLNALGEVDAAISNYRDMLRLNPNDNQRHPL
jgi:hypothetical protein